jgi:uncharacterized protein (TIGR02271 family)
MTSPMSTQDLERLRGSPVRSRDGEQIGSVEQVYVDRDTGQPEWIGIGTGFLKTKRVLVPVQGSTTSADGIQVPYDKDQVKASPDIDEDEISQATERELSSHYGLKYSERRSDTGLPEGAPGRGRAKTKGGQAVTRHEQELKVGKRPTDTGRLRLHKWVEDEPVEADVELRQETATVRREPVNRPASSAQIGEQEIEVPLRGEEPVVEKETVAKERVTAEKDVDTRRQKVTDTVKKERVDTDEDADVKERR